jgi:hypothetical protein
MEGDAEVQNATEPLRQPKLSAALVKAQGAIRAAEKDAANPHLRNRYATLQSVIRATRPHLAANGLALTCAPIVEDGHAGVAWALRHSSGEMERGLLLMPIGQTRNMNPSQACGATISYASRYCRMHLLGCAAGDDVDGAQQKDSSPKKASRPKRAPKAPVESGPVVDTKSPAWKGWQARLAESGLSYERVAGWCEAHDRPRPSKMTMHQWKQLCAWLDFNGGREVVARYDAGQTDG